MILSIEKSYLYTYILYTTSYFIHESCKVGIFAAYQALCTLLRRVPMNMYVQCCHISPPYCTFVVTSTYNLNECYNNTINIHTLSYIIHVQPLYCKQHNATQRTSKSNKI